MSLLMHVKIDHKVDDEYWISPKILAFNPISIHIWCVCFLSLYILFTLFNYEFKYFLAFYPLKVVSEVFFTCFHLSILKIFFKNVWSFSYNVLSLYNQSYTIRCLDSFCFHVVLTNGVMDIFGCDFFGKKRRWAYWVRRIDYLWFAAPGLLLPGWML